VAPKNRPENALASSGVVWQARRAPRTQRAARHVHAPQCGTEGVRQQSLRTRVVAFRDHAEQAQEQRITFLAESPHQALEHRQAIFGIAVRGQRRYQPVGGGTQLGGSGDLGSRSVSIHGIAIAMGHAISRHASV
jgi:hypothetical protein